MTKSTRFLCCLALLLALGWLGCGAGANTPLNTINTGQPATVPSSRTVFVVILENKNYADVVGSASMPYFNGLVAQGALATSYYADVHPSIGNYLMMTTGNIETTDDNFSGVISDDNLARELVTAGKSWKVYAESIPSVGYTGGDAVPYLRHHNPFSYFSDVQQTPSQAANMVPLSQLATDLSSGNLPNVAFVIPNAYDDGHSCAPSMTCTTQQELVQTDNFLKGNLPAILSSSAFQGSGLMAVVWDESENDITNGGGKVAALFLGTNVKAGFQSTQTYQHQNLLRLICDSVGAKAPGLGAAAKTIADIFK